MQIRKGACEGTKRQIDDATEMQGYDKESEDKQISDQNQRLCSISLQSAVDIYPQILFEILK